MKHQNCSPSDNEVNIGKYPHAYSIYMSQFVGISAACLIARSAPDTGDGNLVLFTTSADENVVSFSNHIPEPLKVLLKEYVAYFLRCTFN